MILKGWHIESFGIFSGRTREDLGAGITVLHGPNEAGKSTLLHFIRGVLFGYPTKKQEGSGYIPPLGSGLHGGRLFIEDATGSWTLERMVKGDRVTLTRPDGTKAEPSEVKTLLHGANKTLFNSVFTFELSDLVALDSKDAEEVRDLLFSAGISGAGKNASELGKSLNDEMEGLYKSGRATKPLLNILLAELGEEEKTRKDLIGKAKEYPQRKTELEELSARAAELKEERDAAADRERRLDLLLKLWPLLRSRDELKSKIARLNAPDSFPADGVGRLEAQLDKRGAATLELAELERRELELSSKLELLTVEPELLAKAPDAKLLAESLPLQVERLSRLVEVKGETEGARTNFTATLQSIGNRWTREKVAEIDTGDERQDEAQRMAQALSKSAEDLAVAKRLQEERVESPLGTQSAMPFFATLAGAALIALIGFAAPENLRFAIWLAAVAIALFAFLKLRPTSSESPSAVEGSSTGSEEFATLQTQWREALLQWGLTEDSAQNVPPPDTALHLLTRLRSAKRELTALEQQEKRLTRLEAEIAEWERDANARLDLALQPEGDKLLEAVRTLLREVKEAVDKDALFERLSDERARVVSGKGKYADAKKLAEEELKALYNAAGTEEEEGFRRNAGLYTEQQELKRQREKTEERITALTGEGEGAKALLVEAYAGLVGEWEGEAREVSEGRVSLDRELSTTDQGIGAIGQELKVQENSTKLAESQARIEELRAEAENLARQWRVTALTRALVRNTLDEYAAENQPEALARASELFCALTDGRYQRVVQSPKDDQLLVIRPDGERLRADKQLSRGTREGLYICLRLALAGQYGQRHGKLPLVMDDVLVNLDPVRAEATLTALARFAKDNQVLLFTCHPETVERIKRVDPTVRVLDL